MSNFSHEQNMNFSVLLSIYHKEKPEYLTQALQSIWDAQTIHPTEIVLVKDGPLTPALDAVIAEWQLKLGDIFKVIALEKNVGLGNALNEGLVHCSYEWIFRMDTDDISVPNRFELQLKYIQDHPNIVLLGGQIIEFYKSLEHDIKYRKVPSNYEGIVKFSQKRCPFNHITVAYRKDVILEVGSYQHHLFMEDYNLWLRVIDKGHQVANLDCTLAYARTGKAMLQRRKGILYLQSEWQLFRLKKSINNQSILDAIFTFVLRAGTRLLPASFLQKLYKLLRKSSN